MTEHEVVALVAEVRLIHHPETRAYAAGRTAEGLSRKARGSSPRSLEAASSIWVSRRVMWSRC
jgi:hypothetical protein